MGRAITKDVRAFKRSYAQRPCIKTAALAAGYAPGVAAQGLAKMPKTISTFVASRQRKLDRLAVLARSVDADQQEAIVRGGILSNIAQGKDLAVQSLKLGGQDKRVNMFTADSQVGVFVLEMPAHLGRRIVTALPEHTDDAK